MHLCVSDTEHLRNFVFDRFTSREEWCTSRPPWCSSTGSAARSCFPPPPMG